MNRIKACFGCICAALLLVSGALSVYSYIQTVYYPDHQIEHRNLGWSRDVYVNWKEMYPEEADEPESDASAEEEANGTVDGVANAEASEPSVNTARSVSQVKSYAAAMKNQNAFDKFSEAFETFKKDSKKAVGGRHPFTPALYKLYGLFSKTIGKRSIEDDESYVYRMGDGSLNFISGEQLSPSKADAVIDFANWLKRRGTPLLCVIAGDKADETLYDYPSGIKSFGYANTQRFASRLAENDVPYLISMDVLAAVDPDPSAWFYKTDHHWNANAGLTMAQTLAEIMRSDYGLTVDTALLQSDRFGSVVYKDAFLGSQGKKAKLGYTEREDFEVFYPKYETSFSLEAPNQGKSLIGSFSDTLIDGYTLKNKFCSGYNIYDYYTYWAFTHGDTALVTIDNELCENDTKVLVLKTSKANVINCYLSCAVKRMDILDNRYFTGSVKTYIRQAEPDIVIMISGAPSSNGDNKWIVK